MPNFRDINRRDVIVLPLVALATTLVLLALIMVGAKTMWPEDRGKGCTDRTKDRAAPFCVGANKAAEGDWVENRYNECGYRATGSCRIRPVGSTRLVVLGSSTSWGFLVPLKSVWSVVAAKEIQLKCGGIVDVQSLGGFGGVEQSAARFSEAIALKPQIIAVVITPIDLRDHTPLGKFDPNLLGAATRGAAAENPKKRLGRNRFLDFIVKVMDESGIKTIVQHYRYADQKNFVDAYLGFGDRADYMRPKFSHDWEARMDYVGAAVHYMALRAAQHGIKLLVVYGPSQVQGYMVGGNLSRAGYDPMVLDRAIAQIAGRDKLEFIDGTLMFRSVHDPENYFYRTDGHLNVQGQELLGRTVAQDLLKQKHDPLCLAQG